jgi:hypothetical protein
MSYTVSVLVNVVLLALTSLTSSAPEGRHREMSISNAKDRSRSRPRKLNCVQHLTVKLTSSGNNQRKPKDSDIGRAVTLTTRLLSHPWNSYCIRHLTVRPTPSSKNQRGPDAFARSRHVISTVSHFFKSWKGLRDRCWRRQPLSSRYDLPVSMVL